MSYLINNTVTAKYGILLKFVEDIGHENDFHAGRTFKILDL